VKAPNCSISREIILDIETNAGNIIDYPNPGQAEEQATRRKIEDYNKLFDIADT
jgi:hypothetical protein